MKTSKKNGEHKGHEDETEGKTSSKKLADARSAKVQSAVESAWGKPQPEKIKDVTFGSDNKGHGYRCIVAPVLRDVAAALGLKANTEGFPKVREELVGWEPDNSHWERVKALLMCCCDECGDAMSATGVTDLDDDFLVKAPDLQKARLESMNGGA